MESIWLSTGTSIERDELLAHGVWYERLPLEEEAYRPALEALKAERGYVSEDAVELHPETPNLDGILHNFSGEHRHSDDEVRFVLVGEGVFDIRSEDDRWMRVSVEAGDLIVVPKGRFHRFALSEKANIRCVRLFRDAEGWTPEYRKDK